MDYLIDAIKKHFTEEKTIKLAGHKDVTESVYKLGGFLHSYDFNPGREYDIRGRICQEIEATNPNLKIVKKIGEGGIGLVYQARDKEKKEDVALKVLNPLLFCGLQEEHKTHVINKFKEEYNTGKSLERRLKNSDHAKRILQFKDYQDAGDLHFFTMEYLSSGNLGDFIKKYRSNEEMGSDEYVEKGVEYAIKTLEGLDGLHSCNIVHRDIKPQNILLERNNSGDDALKITDFGLTQSSESLKKRCFADSKLLECTILHVSPEQVKAIKDRTIRITKQSDIYSFGTSFYNYFTGKDRLEDVSQSERFTKLMAIMSEKYELPHNMEGAPEEIAPVISWALNTSPDQRGTALETKYALIGSALRMGIPIEEIRAYSLPFENDVTFPIREAIPYVEDEEVRSRIIEGLNATGHKR